MKTTKKKNNNDIGQLFSGLKENKELIYLIFGSLISADNLVDEQSCSDVISLSKKSLKSLEKNNELPEKDKEEFKKLFEETLKIATQDKKKFKKGNKK